jgi:hypothetical protein
MKNGGGRNRERGRKKMRRLPAGRLEAAEARFLRRPSGLVVRQ